MCMSGGLCLRGLSALPPRTTRLQLGPPVEAFEICRYFDAQIELAVGLERGSNETVS